VARSFAHSFSFLLVISTVFQGQLLWNASRYFRFTSVIDRIQYCHYDWFRQLDLDWQSFVLPNMPLAKKYYYWTF